jgi:pilus assembly protein CpaB
MKGKPAIIISILFGVLGFVFVHLYLRSRETELLQIADERTVVVAVSDILPGTAIEENMVIETEVPLKFVQPSAFTSVREAVGQIAAIPIQKDSQVLGTAMTSVGRSLSTKIPRGMRAVSLAVTDVTGVSSLVAANNYVDVLATVKLGSGLGSSNQRTFVTTLFQNVMVLAVGSDLGEVRTTAPNQDAMAALAQQEKERFSTVTLALTPQQAQDLVLAQDIGDVTLALRSFRDENETAMIPRSNAAAVFGVAEGEVVPRRTPSWQEIRGTVR